MKIWKKEKQKKSFCSIKIIEKLMLNFSRKSSSENEQNQIVRFNLPFKRENNREKEKRDRNWDAAICFKMSQKCK